MKSPETHFPRHKTVLALLLLFQFLVFVAALRGAPSPFVLTAAWLASVPVIVLALLGRGVGRRAGLAVLLGLQIAMTAGGLAVRLGGGETEPGPWIAARRSEWEPRLREVQELVPRLPALADSLLAAQLEQGMSLEDMLRSWSGAEAPTARFPLALALWRGEERVAWCGGLEPFPLADLPGLDDRAAVVRGRGGWYRRGAVTHPEGRLEWQILLAAPPADDVAPAPGELRGQVVLDSEPARGRWQGGPEHGLRYTTDIALEAAPSDMELPLLRLSAVVPSERAERQRGEARYALLRTLGAGLSLAAAGAWLGGVPWLLAGLWLARLGWAVAGLFLRVQPALSRPFMETGPTDPVSLLDPAYFGSAWGGGLLATTADAVLTSLLIALSALALGRRLRIATPGVPAGGTLRRLQPLAFVALAAALLLLQDRLAHEIVSNANARLIGPKVPLHFVTFWGLHLALLVGGAAVTGLLAVLAARLRRGRARGADLMVLLAGVAVAALAAPWLPLWSRLALPPLVMVLWWGTSVLPADDTTMRRLVWLLPVLAAALWNYLACAQAYADGTRLWLERKSEDVTEARSDWVRYLMEDLLAEMAAAEAERPAPPEAHALEAAELWQNWSAFALWQEIGIDDLGLPCRVEILDEAGGPLSLFASGFFRDYGYEIADRGEWELGRPVTPRPQRSLNTYLQVERRRFADGEERILRGQVERLAGEGWLALELPVQSFRTRTLLDRLAGDRDGDDARGYAPRLEVDQPLLMLRRDGRGWRGTGGADLPSRDSQDVVEALMSGERDWGLVQAGGERHLCLWRDDGGVSEPGSGFLLGVRLSTPGDRLLDFSRLILLDLLLLGALGAIGLAASALVRRRRAYRLGFQERFLVVSLVLGLLPLLLAGTFIDRLSREWLAEGARADTRDGLEAAGEQLQGLLAEQARALAGSDYIAGLLDSRFAGDRPLGPYSSRQAMIFDADGELLLDETLSDLDAEEAALLLAKARASSLVLMRDEAGLYLGTLIPVDLATAAPGLDAADPAGALHGPAVRERQGHFFYRQRVTTDLIVGLGEVVQGEATLYLHGEAVLASHPEHIFTGRTPLLLSTRVLDDLGASPGGLHLRSAPGNPHAWTGLLTLPTLHNAADDRVLTAGQVPGALAVGFSARVRDVTGQRERTVLFLAGLATLIFLTATLLALVLTWKIFDPLRVLVDATRRLAGGDFAAPLPESGGDEVGVLSASFGTMRDELSDTQRTLAERERFLARLLERVPVGVAVFDEGDELVTVNPAARGIIDDYFAEAAGNSDERARLLLAGFRREAAGDEGAAELAAPDGRRTLRGRLAPLRLPEGRVDRMLVFEDVTEFLDNKRLALNAQLARQVAHEVKNPLTPIQLSVQFLRQAFRDGAGNLDEIVESTVRQVLEQVELLRSIATEFSLLGRPEDLDVAPLSFPELVDEVVARYRPAETGAGPRVVRAEREVPSVLAHAESLAKVVANLMENSLQAADGTAELELGVAWRVEDESVTLVWTDNGPGLAPEVADRLFDLYFSTKSQGTGLGLPICRNLLARMNGDISLRNREDADGAQVEVTLPRADARPGTTADGGSSAS